MISGPSLPAKTGLLSFNRQKSMVVTSLLTGHNTLRRHPYIMGLIHSPLCKGCEAEEETSTLILCECEALASLKTHIFGSPPLFLGVGSQMILEV
jgi:hypothetical protein